MKKAVLSDALARWRKKIPKENLEDSALLSHAVKLLRKKKKLSGVQLCQKSGMLDPRTLNAIEKGRIQNPSLRTLEAIARGLGMSVSALFQAVEQTSGKDYCRGTAQGHFQIDFPEWGLKMVSFTPLVPSFFCGKWILSSKVKLPSSMWGQPLSVHLSVLVGACEILLREERWALAEGENMFFNAGMESVLSNSRYKETILFVVTSPSILLANDR